jgi:hypothetical protein
MGEWRVLRVLLAVILTFSLAAACGGDDDSTDASDTSAADDDDTTTTDDDSDDSGVDDVSAFFDALGDEGCQGLYSLYASVFAGLGNPNGELGDTNQYFRELADNAPDEIADDFEVLADYMRRYFEALEDAGVDFDDPDSVNDPEAAQKYIEALTELSEDVDSSELEEASNNINDWAQEECPSVAGEG